VKLLSVHVTDETAGALAAARAITGDSSSDVVNQAVLLYEVLLRDGQTGMHATHRLIVNPLLTARLDVNRPWWRVW
jgi:hypothetical protein